MRRTIMIAVAAAAAILAVAAPAAAVVTFDAATGTGFVGKGDVQLAFGWNNATLQANAAGVSFSYTATDSYDAVCTWITGEGTRGEKTHNVTHSTTTEVAGQVTYDARTHKQIDGFQLTGYGTVIESGEIPVVGGACPGNEGTDGTWSSVTQTGSSAGLYTTYGTTTVPLG
ncbi:hypothetical protein AB0H43_26790 [Hamadaea sp. NPDC050747]|uniref:hypothetical protein n=1 Tax=Hamadaea sp. NPDC050747 TaxID=3155789 RepID=UPI0033F3ED36